MVELTNSKPKAKVKKEVKLVMAIILEEGRVETDWVEWIEWIE